VGNVILEWNGRDGTKVPGKLLGIVWLTTRFQKTVTNDSWILCFECSFLCSEAALNAYYSRNYATAEHREDMNQRKAIQVSLKRCQSQVNLLTPVLTVVVGMSGGVDSSVAALLLAKEVSYCHSLKPVVV
jgi:hypothetical protein